MKKQNYLILLTWGCCVLLDRWLGLDHPSDPVVQYSFIGAIIGGVASLASGIIGSAAANKRRRQAEAEMEKQKSELKAWRDSELGTNYLDRADSRAAMRRILEHNKEVQKSVDTNAVRRGMTDEAKVAHAAKLNQNYADAVSQIAAAGSRHKDRVQGQYRSETQYLDGLKIQNMMDASGVDNMVQGITGAAGALGTALSGVKGLGVGQIGKMAAKSRANQNTSKVANVAAAGFGMPTLEEELKSRQVL